MKPSVFLTRRLPEPVMRRLEEATDLTFNPENSSLSKQEIIAGLGEKDALVPNVTDAIDAEIIRASPNLKVIANFGVGFNNIDVATATQTQIPVTNTPGVLTEATADIAFGLLLSSARRFSEGEQMLRAEHWAGWHPLQLLGADLNGATLGLIGFGRIGQAVARRAKGFDMRIIYWNRTRLDEVEEERFGVEYVEREQLIEESDFISLHVAYVPETHHLIDAEVLGKMKTSAILVNTTRGPVVDEKALVDGLRAKTIAGAGLDVYENEPALEPGLADLPNCTLLPHLGSATTGTRVRMGMMAVDNLLAVCSGKRPPNCVNPEVL